MKRLGRFDVTKAILVGLVTFTAVVVRGQEVTAGNSSVSGRITIGGQPAQGISVIAAYFESARAEGPRTSKATTDSAGYYRIAQLAAGRYFISAVAPAFVGGPPKTVTLADGEEAGGIDFPLTKGGVITGRVTTADGRPVVLESVALIPVIESGDESSSGFGGMPQIITDDRGIYRAYGVAPGRYRVSAGGPNGMSAMIGMLMRRPTPPRTFHPNASEEAEGAVVEVGSGSEVANVDITLGIGSRTYKVRGRVIDADTGKPVRDAIPIYASRKEGETFLPGMAAPTNSTGEFRFEAVRPGRYAAGAVVGDLLNPAATTDFYSEKTDFEIVDTDVSGLELKVRRGGSISGFVIIEGTPDPALSAKLAECSVNVVRQITDIADHDEESDEEGEAFFDVDSNRSKIGPDGAFQIRGLRPGKKQLQIAGNPAVRLLSVERNGVPIGDGIELGAGQHITDVRVIVEYGTAVIRGQVRFEGSGAPKDAHLMVIARSKRNTDANRAPDTKYASVDDRGAFVIEGVVSGEYEVELVLTPLSTGEAPSVFARETIRVTQGAETTIVLVADVRKKLNSR